MYKNKTDIIRHIQKKQKPTVFARYSQINTIIDM